MKKVVLLGVVTADHLLAASFSVASSSHGVMGSVSRAFWSRAMFWCAGTGTNLSPRTSGT